MIEQTIAHDPNGTVEVLIVGGPSYNGAYFTDNIVLPTEIRNTLEAWTSLEWANFYSEIFYAYTDVTEWGPHFHAAVIED